MRGRLTVGVLLGTLLCAASALGVEPATVSINDNRAAAGKLENGILRLDLELVEGRWFPEADDGPSVVVHAFAEAGQPPRIPGPMIRVPQGTEVHLRIANRVALAAKIYGLQARPASAGQSFDLAAGESREMRFRLDAPGTFHYWASTSGKPMVDREELDSTLSGAIIVDPPGAPPNDRVLVIGTWFEPGDKLRRGSAERAIAVVNGKSWPHTERLHYKLGEEVHWRVINVSWGMHPMHLHGTYFRVDSLGDGASDTIYSQAQQRMAVTENMGEGATMSMTWWPDREGRWVFHCHILAHISSMMTLAEAGQEDHSDHHGAGSGMRGLVMGILVTRDGPAGIATVPQGGAPREMRLVVRKRDVPSGSAPTSVGFMLGEGGGEPVAEALGIPGPPLVLHRMQPVAITVENRLDQPTSIHWHGIELESYFDGVPGWGGIGSQVTPAIAPGSSFVVRFTPPRAGTFIYHTHWHEILQLTTGLYGPILVLGDGEKYSPDTDRVYLASRGGPDDDKDPFLLNGSATPPEQKMKVGRRYRMRFINITAHNTGLRFALQAGDKPLEWRALAKDGWTMPKHQQTLRPSRQLIGVGETYDFVFEPKTAGKLELALFARDKLVATLPITVGR